MQQKNMLAVLALFDFQLQTAVGISIICSFTQALDLKCSFLYLISFNSQHMFCSDPLQWKTHVYFIRRRRLHVQEGSWDTKQKSSSSVPADTSMTEFEKEKPSDDCTCHSVVVFWGVRLATAVLLSLITVCCQHRAGDGGRRHGGRSERRHGECGGHGHGGRGCSCDVWTGRFCALVLVDPGIWQQHVHVQLQRTEHIWIVDCVVGMKAVSTRMWVYLKMSQV